MSLQEFFDELEKHDWYYEYSDDQRVWDKGNTNSKRLSGISEESEEHKKLYKDYTNHMYSGETFEKEKIPKPDRP